MKHLYFYLCSALLTASFCLMSCQEDTESFNNKAFISSGQTTTLLLKGNSGIIEKTVQATIAKPTQQDIHISYKTDPSLIATYNAFYYDHAIELPEECYEIPEANAVISAGSIKSTIVSIYFKNLESLDRDLVYVLPVSISDVNMDILESGRTSYFIIKGAALINTAANISNIGLYPNLANADAMNNLEKLTAEALIRVDEFGKGISTIMGVEAKFLIRIGDSEPENQIQLATANGNLSDASWVLPTKEWVHVALTWDSADGAVNLYLNGVKKGNTKTSNYRSKVNWGVHHETESESRRGFWVGYSYKEDRDLKGDICEVRVWNRVLTAEEIKARNHFYMVEPDADGLVSYWKFDEGSGSSIKDYTVNGNHLVGSSTPTWKPVELPEK
ncbi:DUF1735 and LamG domain-containing protein [Bacteroides ovatus]|uniref:DUF1735 and LamG domain-containing protein n=1 Tax=Bacteroides ovatus TaxID=28116 RepID=UPI0022E72870|nr:DUF1735 and LamG domain-containing protein [Bacteroides ovatus]